MAIDFVSVLIDLVYIPTLHQAQIKVSFVTPPLPRKRTIDGPKSICIAHNNVNFNLKYSYVP
jgi:hypothetical protein